MPQMGGSWRLEAIKCAGASALIAKPHAAEREVKPVMLLLRNL